MLSSIKHGVSHVAHNPIVQAAAHAAAQATIDTYLHLDQQLEELTEQQLEELTFKSFAKNVGGALVKVAKNPAVQAAARAAAKAAADKYLKEELEELGFLTPAGR